MNTHKIALLAILSVFTFGAYADTTPDISGTYKCSGFDPYSQKNFNENLVFTKTGATYSMQLIDSSSTVPYMLGTAMFNSDTKNAFSFVCWDPNKPESFGVGLYQIKADGSLDGVWTTKDTTQVGTETCTKAN